MNRAGSPFSPRVVLGMLLFGAVAFLLTLYFIGAGETGPGDNNGGEHVGGKGLNGFAAWAALLQKEGYTVERNRNEGALARPGLLVLTPPPFAKGEDIAKAVNDRRYVGPTLIVLPKWMAGPASNKRAKKGWVDLSGTMSPKWEGFADDVTVTIGKVPGWRFGALSGRLPREDRVQSGGGASVIPLIRGGNGRILAGYLADDGTYPWLNELAGMPESFGGSNEDIHPVILVFEPDLLDNYGMARRENGQLAVALADALVDRGDPIMFDLTLNGLGRSANLLTLAFTPPFLAATLCLVLAAIVVGWRAFRPFGPPLAEARRIAFGKRQLVANSAGFIRRTGRLHLLGPPYAALLRDRMARMLGIRVQADGGTTEAEIDRLLQARGMDPDAFTIPAERLRAARNPNDLLRGAHALKTIERMLTQ